MVKLQTHDVAGRLHAYILDELDAAFEETRLQPKPDSVWRQLRGAGSRLWLDTGDIDEASALWNAEFEALTTNNTLLNKEVQKGMYDAIVGKAAGVIRAAAPRIDTRTLLLEIAFVLNACHGLRLVRRLGAFVSVELHTDLAHDVARAVDYGQRYHALCPDRFIVKVPLTPAGFLGARKLGRLGIPVNFTLGFSARQNYLAARLARPAYVNVFLGRLNAFVKDHQLGDGENVGEKAVLATQRVVRELRDRGGSGTALIGASLRNGDQVAAIAGVDVLTIPTKAAAEFHQGAGRGRVSSRVADDPPIALAGGVALRDFNGATLWDVTDGFRKCVDDFVDGHVDAAGPDDLLEHLRAGGCADALPRWTDRELGIIATDGKIPVFKTWKEALASGRIGLDALMNASGLLSFTRDQKALDDRVASLV